jgi:hypothetical protein
MNLRTASAALVAAIALASCGGSPPPAPEAAPAAAPKSEAISRADAMIADMKKRQAALEQADRAVPGKAAKAPTPAVVEPSPAAKPRPATRDTAPTTPSTPTTAPIRSQLPRGVDVISSNYTVAEQGKAFWRFSWKTSVRNQQRTPIRVRVEMDFKDAKGVLISAGEQTININGGAVADVTGFVSVKATDGPRVASATPRIALLK